MARACVPFVPFVSSVPLATALDLAGAECFSSELSSRSVESPSLVGRGIPRTGVRPFGSSSSLESAKRLLDMVARPCSSSLESPKRLEKCDGGFDSDATDLAFEELRKLKRDGDLVRLALLESLDILREVRAGLLTSGDPLIDVRMPPAPFGPVELKGRLAVESAGDVVRAFIEVTRVGIGSFDWLRIERFIWYLLPSGVFGRAFLKLLSLSELARCTFGLAAGNCFCCRTGTGAFEAAGVGAEMAEE